MLSAGRTSMPTRSPDVPDTFMLFVTFFAAVSTIAIDPSFISAATWAACADVSVAPKATADSNTIGFMRFSR